MRFLSHLALIVMGMAGPCLAQTSTPTITPTSTPTITPTVTNTPTITPPPTITPYPDFKVTYEFSPGTDIRADEMNTNFGDCEVGVSNIVGKWIVDHTITNDDLSRSSDIGGACIATDNIQDQAVRSRHIYSDIAGDAIGWDSGVLKVNVDDSTIERSGDAIRIKSGGIGSAQIANGAILDEHVDVAADISGAKIKDQSIGVVKLDATGETNGYIAVVIDGNVRWAALGDIGLGVASVGTVNIVDGSVTAAKLAAVLKNSSGWGLVPVGAEMGWPVATPPAGWLIENGQPVSRTTYGTLFAVIGTTYGSGNGTTTFNLPNYTNRVGIGAGDIYVVAESGGAAAHTHAAGSYTAPSHAHTISNHTHSIATHVHSSGNLFAAMDIPYASTSIWALLKSTDSWDGNRNNSFNYVTGGGGYGRTVGIEVRGTTAYGGPTATGSGGAGNTGTGGNSLISGTSGNGSSLPPYLSAYRIIKY